MNPELRDRLRSGAPCYAIVAHVATTLAVPVALLYRVGETWRVRDHAQPESATAESIPEIPSFRNGEDADVTADLLAAWTAVPLDSQEPASKLLILPGPAERWQTPIMRQLMSDVAVVLDLVTMREEAAAARRTANLTHGLAEALSNMAEGEAPYDVALGALVSAVDAEIGALGVIPIGETRLSLKATRGYPNVLVSDLRIAAGEGILGQVLASGAPLLVTEASRHYAQCARRRRYRSDAFIVVPLKAADDVIGLVSITDRRGGRPLDATDLETLRELTPAVTLATARARLHEHVATLQYLATQDPLTGLANRRSFRERMEAEVPRARRQRLPLAVLMIDADGFKAINDRFGHAAGDAVLKDVAEVLRRTVRVFDVCARLGGDEFAVLMPGSDTNAAANTADRIRRQLSALAFPPGASSPPLKLTVSIGIAVLPSHGDDDDLLVEADRALYEAKAAGGDHIRVWSRPAAAASA